MKKALGAFNRLLGAQRRKLFDSAENVPTFHGIELQKMKARVAGEFVARVVPRLAQVCISTAPSTRAALLVPSLAIDLPLCGSCRHLVDLKLAEYVCGCARAVSVSQSWL